MSGSRTNPAQTLLLCLLSLTLILLSQIQKTKFFTSTINSTTGVILRPLVHLKQAIDYQLSTLNSIPHQYRLLLDQERQISTLQIQAQLVQSLRDENDLLRRQLQLRPTLPPQSIATTITSFNRFALISAGSRQGVSLDYAVTRDNLLIGTVTEVYPNAAKVRLISDPDFNIDAITSRGSSGKVTHTGDQLVFTNVLQKDSLQAEDSVFTKGSPHLPPNLLIGKIGRIVSNQSDIYQSATIQLPTYYQDHEPVLVISY
ncbi:hypothetical protein A2368_01295 [Candidatus Collierbacteria bacterium RIFOXYB1_FULL_49_13]|uniref:Cell shape-determining protein MreC n=1 Tax=Candidatus Collierbacteria bacterium RIFOXYB1_FULL_49_13 TaxID=1817728 RepID=A0A1F5FIG6_9BACT|nr:MAG: hypothetical protein A2368_01295 [Candidatus Collierbacteria bacterium RIFOXYB1_FULL_49_13]